LKTAGLSPRWLFVTTIVFLAGVFLHLPVTDFCDWLAREYGFTAYDDAVRLGAMTLGTGAFLAVWLWPDRHRVPIGIAVTGLLALAVIAHKVIVVNAIESIHYPQYAVMAVLLARSGFGLEPAWLGATLLGAVDEGYQAVALPRGAPDYFDWNDVLLNGIGAAFGALIVVMTGFAVMQNGRVPSMARWSGLALAIAFAFVMNPPVWSPFLEATPGGRLFHRMSASEAMVVLAIVYGLVVAVEARVRRRGGLPPA